MTFLSPEFGWCLLALPVILVLYLLKRRYVEHPVPSTFLWRRAARDTTASRPLQRLRRNILLPIQLLMAAALVLGLMRPAIPGGMAGEVVMIFDLSASMQARENGRTRLDRAVDAAEGLIAGMGAGDALTILAADGGARQVLSRSTDRDAARRALEGLTPTNQDCDLSGAVSLAEAMRRELDGVQVVVFSDDYVPPEGVSAQNVGSALDNRAVASFTVEGGAGYARVANYGADCDVTLACYAGDALCDAKALHIPAGETAGTTFDVPDCAWARVEIREADAIAADNQLYFVPQRGERRTVALAGAGSVFLERALGLREDVALVRVADDNMASVQADLYVYGDSPLVFSLDPQQDKIAAGDELEPQGTPVLAGRDEVTAGLTLSEVAVRAYRPLEGGTALMTIDGNSVLARTDRAVVLGFDIHDSNLPLKYDFPILIQNILNQLLPEELADVDAGECGGAVRIALPTDAQQAWVELPDGETIEAETMDSWNGSGRFEATEQAGLYAVHIEGGERAGVRHFSLRVPLSESDVRSVAPSVDAGGGAASLEGGAELTPWLLGLFLLLLMIEWVVSRRVA